MGEHDRNINNQDLSAYFITTLMNEAILADSKNYREEREGKTRSRDEVLEKVWGKHPKNFYFSPSFIATCIRQQGYAALGYKPAQIPVENEKNMKSGSALHYAYTKTLSNYGLSEQTIIDTEHRISGRYDLLIFNQQLSEWILYDFKTTSKQGLSYITRDGLPDYLRGTKKTINLLSKQVVSLLSTCLC